MAEYIECEAVIERIKRDKTTLLFVYTVVINAVGIIIGRMSKRLDYEKKRQK